MSADLLAVTIPPATPLAAVAAADDLSAEEQAEALGLTPANPLDLLGDAAGFVTDKLDVAGAISAAARSVLSGIAGLVTGPLTELALTAVLVLGSMGLIAVATLRLFASSKTGGAVIGAAGAKKGL